MTLLTTQQLPTQQLPTQQRPTRRPNERPTQRLGQKGFSLLELMIAIAILSILAGVAIPAYQGYLQNSREAKLLSNIATIEVFQEDFRLRTGSYQTTGANLAAITAAIDWEPQSNDGTTYILGASGTGYSVTATDTQGTSVCMVFPDKTRC